LDLLLVDLPAVAGDLYVDSLLVDLPAVAPFPMFDKIWKNHPSSGAQMFSVENGADDTGNEHFFKWLSCCDLLKYEHLTAFTT